MKIQRINEHILAYNLAVHDAVRHKIQEYQHMLEKKGFDRIEETRVQRAIRLNLDKGTHVDVDC
jgi:hypothetical protein